jgi:spermidine synthase
VTETELFRAQTALQEIVLARRDDGSINLTLDGVWQFDSHDEHVFHEVLADVPMVLAPQVRSVLVLGGGDGLALRNVLRYPDVERAVLVEIDAAVIAMTREVEAMRELSASSLDDPRVQVRVEDAREYLRSTSERFDVVICDFPAATAPELAGLFSRQLYSDVDRVMHDESVASIQVSQDPPGFWDVLAEVEAVFPWAMPLLVELTTEGSPEPGWADFVVASRRARTPVRDPAEGTRFFTLERLPGLVIQNRSGDELEVAATIEGT